jgi:serine/threonine protein phosphatase PrpC
MEGGKMRKSNSNFKTSFVSEPGTFITNKGCFAFVELDDVACWVMADGLDSDEEKESAQIAVHRIFEEFVEKPQLSRAKIRGCLQNAHQLLESESRNVRLKVGLIMLVTDYSKIIWATAGNTRLYHFRNGMYNFRSKDQTIAQLMVDSGKITESELNEHDERNNLINYLGKSSVFKPFVSRKYRLWDGDVMILGNSGFWENIYNEELGVAVRDSKDAEELVDNLEDALLGKQNEVLNNYSIAAIYATKVFQEKTIDYLKIAKRGAVIVLPLLLVLGIGLFINKQMLASRLRNELIAKRQKVLFQKKSVAAHERNGDQMVKGEKYQEAVGEYREALNIIRKNNLNLSEEQELLVKKYDTTLFIVDGDNFFSGQEYQKALNNYLKASQAAEAIRYDQNGIMSRISKTKGTITMHSLIKAGDAESIRQNFTGAKDQYQLALNIAEQIDDSTMKPVIEAKITNAEQKKQEVDKERKVENERDKSIYRAKSLEKLGDDKYNSRKYKEALETYKMARRAYEGLGLTQEILIVDEKIKNSEKKTKKILWVFPRG